MPDLHVTISSDITREFREYERASTTTLSAYVQPVIDRYIARFRTRLESAGFRGRFSVMGLDLHFAEGNLSSDWLTGK